MNHKNDHKHNNKSSGCCDNGEAKKPEKDNVKKTRRLLRRQKINGSFKTWATALPNTRKTACP